MSYLEKKWIWPTVLFLIACQLLAQGTTVPPPKTEAEVRELMKLTSNLHIIPPGVSPELFKSLLEIGEMIIYYDHLPEIPWMTTAGILVNVPVEQVFSVLTDYPHYKDFVPLTEGAEVFKIQGDFIRVDFHLKVQMSILHYRMDYGVYHYDQFPYRTEWAHAWGEFGVNSGFAEIIPSSDGKQTMFFYSAYSKPASSFLKTIYATEPSLEMLTSLSAATMFTRAIKSESEKRFAAAGGKMLSPSAPKPILEVLSRDPAGLKKILEQGNLVILEDGPTVYAISV